MARSLGLSRRRNALDGLPLLTVVALSGTLFVSVLRPPWKDRTPPTPQPPPAAAAQRAPEVLPAMALQALETEQLARDDRRQP